MAKIIEEAPKGIRSRCNHCSRLIEYNEPEINKKFVHPEYAMWGHYEYLVKCPGCEGNMNVNKTIGLNEKGEPINGVYCYGSVYDRIGNR